MNQDQMSERVFTALGKAVCPHCQQLTAEPFARNWKLRCWHCKGMFPDYLNTEDTDDE